MNSNSCLPYQKSKLTTKQQSIMGMFILKKKKKRPHRNYKYSHSNKLEDVVSNMLWRERVFSSQILIKLAVSVW